jgi:glycerophosphoryl diester phosphodiesterase
MKSEHCQFTNPEKTMHHPFEIVAHRGVLDQAPENTLQAFERAIQIGVDAVEFDVRLTADWVPVVYHYLYLDEITTSRGPIFDYTLNQIREMRLQGYGNEFRISTFEEVLEKIGGRIGMEIELKGPEPEAAQIVGETLRGFKHLWDTIEVTSFEPKLLTDLKEFCPGLTTDLLFPRSEPWMKLDVVAYLALHRARLAGARAVHLHPSQLNTEVVSFIRTGGIEIHAWDVDDLEALNQIMALAIPKFSTDKTLQAIKFRKKIIDHESSIQ